MEAGELYLLFTEPLERLGLEYMVTGSVASSSYGEPRFTHDIDVVLDLPAARLEDLQRAFPASDFYCPPLEALRVEASRERDGHFNLIHQGTAFKADVYLMGDDPLHAWAWSRRVRVEVGEGRSLWLAPPEYVILRKLQFHAEGGGERHLRDIRTMLEVGRDDLDQPALEEWIRRLDLTATWEQLESPLG